MRRLTVWLDGESAGALAFVAGLYLGLGLLVMAILG